MEDENTTKSYYKGLIESLIFLSSEPVKLSLLANTAEIEKTYARELVDELILDYMERDGGVVLREVAGGYKFYSNEKYYPILSKIFKERKKTTLSKSTLDTLAIVAYKQPITLPEIEEIRGYSSRAMVTSLISKKLIKAVGQKEVPGRPTLYGTTNEFLIHFGISKLSELPPPEEVKELKFENIDELIQKDVEYQNE